jgi:hypothetical protein
MYSTLCLTAILVLINSILGVNAESNPVIIGSSIGGVLGLVSINLQDD